VASWTFNSRTYKEIHDEPLEARVQGYWNRITSQLLGKHEKD